MVSPARAFEVVVVGNRCKECAMCINICPKDVLIRGDRLNRKGYRATKPVKPEACVGCKICEWACPDFALFIKPAADGVPLGKVLWDDEEEVVKV